MYETKIGQVLFEKLGWAFTLANFFYQDESFCKCLQINYWNRKKSKLDLKEGNDKFSSSCLIPKPLREKNAERLDVLIWEVSDFLCLKKPPTAIPMWLKVIADIENKIISSPAVASSLADEDYSTVDLNCPGGSFTKKFLRAVHSLIAFSSTELNDKMRVKVWIIRLNNEKLFDLTLLNELSLDILYDYKINYSTRNFIQKLFAI